MPNKTQTTKQCTIIGAPFGGGQNILGVQLAPQMLREANLIPVLTRLGWNCDDKGDLPSCEASLSKKDLCQPQVSSSASIKQQRTFQAHQNPYQCNVENSQVCGKNNETLFRTLLEVPSNHFALTLGGDHSIASASIAAALVKNPDLKVVWIDAHGDINTPVTSPSGHYHGMPVAHLLGWFKESVEGFEWIDDLPKLKEKNLVYIGLRDLDDAEKEMLRKSEIKCYSMTEVDLLGIGGVLKDVRKHFEESSGLALEDDSVYISLDVDGCDPLVAPGTGTKAMGGLSYREIQTICRYFGGAGCVVGMDLVEINPTLDEEEPESMHGDDMLIRGTPTVRLGVELVASVMGRALL